MVDAVARGPSRLRFIVGKTFLQALGNYPVSTHALIGALSEQLQDTLNLLAGLRHGTSSSRMAGLLVNLAGDQAGRFSIDVTQQELADLLGITRVTANHALRELQGLRLIKRSYGSIAILDRDRLVQFSLE